MKRGIRIQPKEIKKNGSRNRKRNKVQRKMVIILRKSNKTCNKSDNKKE